MTASAPRWGSTRRSRSGPTRCGLPASACQARKRSILPRSSTRAPPRHGETLSDEARAVTRGRVEDFALLTGHGRFADDLPVRTGTLHAAILRSPLAHAEIAAIDTTAALALPGVACVLTGDDVSAAHAGRSRSRSRPAMRAMVPRHRPGALCRRAGRGRRGARPPSRRGRARSDRGRVPRLAGDRRPARGGRSRCAGAAPDGRQQHRHERRFRYGDPEAAFAAAPHRISITVEYPRNAGTPIECFVVIAEYLPGEGIYEITANFQGPLAMHPVMALALGVPANRLRLKTPPDSGGSFGVEARGVPLYRAAGAGGAAGRAAGQMGRDPARASRPPRPRRPTG